MKNFTVLFFTFILVINLKAQKNIFQINKELGKGVNFGNIFEAPRENEWGNPFRDDYPKRIKAAGFNHIRIPIRWDTPERAQQTSPFTITPAFLNRIKYVVDLAIKEDLTVIVNMHHHEEIFANPANAKPRFLAQWNQIAAFFKDYSDRVIFEVMNEPHNNLTPELWNQYFSDALKEIRKTNPTRAVLMGTAEFGGVGAINKLVLPNDPNIIVTVHYYNPFPFTHQGADWVGSQSIPWLGTKWNDTEAERDALKSEIKAVLDFSKKYNVPINMGEFGAYDRADMASRVRWTTFLARYFESLDFSWAYWEWSAGFGVFRPSTNTFNQSLLDALIKNPLPQPTKVILKPVYTSNFDSSADGWTLATFSGANGSISNSAGELNLNINTIGTQAWNVQLTKGGFKIEKDKIYRLSVECKSATSNSFTYLAGKATDPWNSYSGYPSANPNEKFQVFSTVFNMTDLTDNSARIVFDLGSKVGNIQVKKVLLEEVTLDFSTSYQVILKDNNLRIYPNPSSNRLQFFTNQDQSEKMIKVYNVNGAEQINLMNYKGTEIDITPLKSGEYVLSVSSELGFYIGKFIKL